MEKLDFSLIIPCFNEEYILENGIESIVDIFRYINIKYEIIFVDDKSSDNTLDIIERLIKRHRHWKLIKHMENKGRGMAVVNGIKASSAPIVGFIDIDLSTSPWYLARLFYEVKNGADIATAMRVYKLKPKTLFRWVISKGYNFVMRLFLNCRLQDTETGCKVFNKEKILPILDKTESAHWFWDTEVMVLAYTYGYNIREIPSIFIRESLYSRVRLFKDTFDYIINLFRFRKRLTLLSKKI